MLAVSPRPACCVSISLRGPAVPSCGYETVEQRAMQCTQQRYSSAKRARQKAACFSARFASVCPSAPLRLASGNLNQLGKTPDQCLLQKQLRLIDKSRVTCVKWVPGSESLFLVAHSSGNMYLYNVEHTCGTTAPHYQLLKQGESFAVHTCKSKSTRNPLLKWTVGEGALNEFAFSPDGKFLACVSQDGFLRVFNFDSVELHGTMKSYFGGLLCVCWSPDGKYIVTGGEDDLVTVWSFLDCRVIARGHGHKSWVSVVAFDPYTTSVEESDPMEFSGSDEDFQDLLHFGRDRANSTQSRLSKRNSTESRPVSVTYRFGSVGQDTQLCLWDLTEDILFPHQPLSRARTHTNVMNATSPPAGSTGNSVTTPGNSAPPPLPRSNSLPHSAVSNAGSKSSVADGAIASGVSKFATLSLHDRKDRHHEKDHKRNHSMGHISSKSSDKLNLVTKTKTDPAKTLGTPLCPRMEDVPLLEPLICYAGECILNVCLVPGLGPPCWVSGAGEGLHGPGCSPSALPSDACPLSLTASRALLLQSGGQNASCWQEEAVTTRSARLLRRAWKCIDEKRRQKSSAHRAALEFLSLPARGAAACSLHAVTDALRGHKPGSGGPLCLPCFGSPLVNLPGIPEAKTFRNYEEQNVVKLDQFLWACTRVPGGTQYAAPLFGLTPKS
ncbi:hypothetical protein HPG69_009833 [Diceros bicornis minor]|uniref:WD repeat-containing protein 20 n=1 Tax=Diceros bicornis minor TaxID=77932 RepID=A0A7J7EW98_DICBM|nr:hypothetical protein HPG69_009833 [Diceros bicornis minor]